MFFVCDVAEDEKRKKRKNYDNPRRGKNKTGANAPQICPNVLCMLCYAGYWIFRERRTWEKVKWETQTQQDFLGGGIAE